MKRVHYIDSYLINPQHPVTVNVIGAGGTGSQVLTCLARLDTALRGLGHPGLLVTVYDPDTVTEANIGRQLFSPSDTGLNKAQCLVTRVNNFFGNGWRAVPDIYPAILKDARRDNLAHLTITCPVEHAESRAGFGIQKLRNAALLDGLRKHTDRRPGRAGNGTEENQATGFQAIRNCQLAESHHPNGEIHKGKGERFRSELLAGGGPGEAGPVHQFHIGAARLQHPVEDVPPRNDRASRSVPQPGDDESQSDSGVTVCCAIY